MVMEASTEHREEFSVKDVQEQSPFTITGHVSSSVRGCGRGSIDRQFYFINSRPCELDKACIYASVCGITVIV